MCIITLSLPAFNKLITFVWPDESLLYGVILNYQLAKAERAIQRQLILCRKDQVERSQRLEIKHNEIRIFIYSNIHLFDQFAHILDFYTLLIRASTQWR